MPAPIGRLLQGRGKHGVFEILQRRAMMLAPARLALGAVQGTVEVAKPYGAARRCMQLQDWHDCAVQGTVLVEILWRSAKMLALQDVQDCAVRGAVLAKNLAMQHDDA